MPREENRGDDEVPEVHADCQSNCGMPWWLFVLVFVPLMALSLYFQYAVVFDRRRRMRSQHAAKDPKAPV